MVVSKNACHHWIPVHAVGPGDLSLSANNEFERAHRGASPERAPLTTLQYSAVILRIATRHEDVI